MESDFVRLFETHKYALSQIEKLTPQGLSILKDYRAWPQFALSNFSAEGGRITSDWRVSFIKVYAPIKGIADPSITERLQHSLNELQSYRLTEAFVIPTQNNGHLVETKGRLNLSSIGQLIVTYLEG